MGNAPVFRRGETVFLQSAQTLLLGFRFLRSHQVVGKKAEGTTGCHSRIQLTQAPCRRIPGISKFRFSCFYPFFVQTQEGLPGHIHFPPDIQQLRCFFALRNTQPLRDSLDGPHVGSNIFSHFPVPPGSSPHQPAVFIDQAAGQAVDFRFQHIADLSSLRQQAPHPLVEVSHFSGIIHISQTQHGNHMLHLRKARGHIPTGTLGR